MSAFDFIKDSARSVVTTAKVWPTIMKATADDETPTPGYVIEELARMTWEDEDLCQEVLSSLLKRLDKDAPFVKVKALRCIRYIVQKGHESFHRDIQRRADPIRDATQFRGPQDPLRGDANNKAVRDLAAEVLPVVFAAPNTIKRERPASLGGVAAGALKSGSSGQIPSLTASGGGSSQAYVPPRMSAAPPPASGTNPDGSKKMWGYGNPNFKETTPSLLDRVKDAVVDALTQPQSSQYGPTMYTSSGSVYQPPAAYEAARHSRPTLSSSEEYEHRKRGEVGGGWATATVPQLSSQRDSQAVPVPMALANGEEEEEESEEEEEDDEDEGAAPSRPAGGLPTLADTASAPAPAKVPAAPLAAASAPASVAACPHSVLEQRLVDELTSGGVRTTVPADALKAFCQRCRSLNLAAVVAALKKRMTDDVWQTQLRALVVAEALLTQSVPAASDVLLSASSTLNALRSSPKPAIQSKAEKAAVMTLQVLLLLGVEPVHVPADGDAAVPAAPATESGTSSFDFLNLAGPEGAPEPATVPGPGFGLLEGLAVLPATTAAAAGTSARPMVSTKATDLLLDFSADGVPASAGASVGGGKQSLEDLLGLTSLGEPAMPSATATQPSPLGAMAGAWRPPPLPGSAVPAQVPYIGAPGAVPPGVPGAVARPVYPVAGVPVGAGGAYGVASYPPGTAAYPAPAYAAPPNATLAIDPNLVGRGPNAPNYNVSSGQDKRTSSSSSFNFVADKRDAFDFVQESLKKK